MLLKIHTETDGDTLRAKLSGEFDFNGLAQFREEIEESHSSWRRAEIDLSDVVFMDSSGLQALVSLNNRAREQGLEVTLVSPSHPVTRLLALTGLESHFAVRG